VFELVGWAGAVLVLIAYAMVTRYGTSAPYHALNLLGAAGLLANSMHHGALPPTALNALWSVIAVWGIGAASKSRKSAVKSS
jgi:hypothetical protein